MATLRLKKAKPYDLSALEWTCDDCGKRILQDKWSRKFWVKYCTCKNRQK